MTLKDFFHLSDEEFATRISTSTNEELLKDDIHNCRTAHSGTYGATLGVLEAPVTAGVSLVGSAIGLRRRNVAKRRLEMIHQELEKRGLPAHKPDETRLPDSARDRGSQRGDLRGRDGWRDACDSGG
ncbi:hypothetical protein LTR87_009426 [Friedmanniomyces endolithicus]|nr:hypothetical protein LTR87_009426 [Friedmanniomyces endolithicus]